jgi:hypothetical protein
MVEIRVQNTDGEKHKIKLPAKYGVMKVRELVKKAFKYTATVYYYGKKLTKDNYKEAVAKDVTLIYRRPPCKLDTKTKRCNRKIRFGGDKSVCKLTAKKRCMKK